MKHCPFCDPAELEPRTLFTSDHASVIMSSPRLVRGHLLVIPLRHVERPWELEPGEAADLLQLVLKYQKLLADRIAPGCDVVQRFRPFTPQNRIKVDHVHYHLLPRDKEEPVMDFSPQWFRDLRPQEVREVRRSLRPYRE